MLGVTNLSKEWTSLKLKLKLELLQLINIISSAVVMQFFFFLLFYKIRILHYLVSGGKIADRGEEF